MNKLEISVNTKEEAIIAQAGGADRLEVTNQELFGGITPTIEDITEVITHTVLPCYIQLRPTVERWSLTDEEFNKMLHIIEISKIAGVKGIITGAIIDGKIDKEKVEKIIEVKGDLKFVFSHAIDSTYDYEGELEYLINNPGIDGIITNGSARTIFDGVARLKPFIEKIKDKLVIGGSVTAENISILREAGFEGITYQCTKSLTDEEGRLSLDKIKKFKESLN